MTLADRVAHDASAYLSNEDYTREHYLRQQLAASVAAWQQAQGRDGIASAPCCTMTGRDAVGQLARM